MAKVKGPLFSMGAGGNIAHGAIQFRTDRGRIHAYKPTPPAKQNQAPASDRQASQRVKFADAKAAWVGLPQIERDNWAALAEQDGGLTGWNLFLRYALLGIDTLENALLTDAGQPLLASDGNAIITG